MMSGKCFRFLFKISVQQVPARFKWIQGISFRSVGSGLNISGQDVQVLFRFYSGSKFRVHDSGSNSVVLVTVQIYGFRSPVYSVQSSSGSHRISAQNRNFESNPVDSVNTRVNSGQLRRVSFWVNGLSLGSDFSFEMFGFQIRCRSGSGRASGLGQTWLTKSNLVNSVKPS
ncbi:hypothetical protein Hanom_Chr04g00344101 [Helianthus anomalus]